MNALREFQPATCPICDLGRGLTLTLPEQTQQEDADELLGAWWTGYDVDVESVFATRRFGLHEHDVNFRASEVRRVGQLVWCHVAISYDLHPLSWAVLCVDHPAERNALADAAWEALHPHAKIACGRLFLRQLLDRFCAGIWLAWDERPLGSLVAAG